MLAGLKLCVLVLAHQLLVEVLGLVEVTFEHRLLDEPTTEVCSNDEQGFDGKACQHEVLLVLLSDCQDLINHFNSVTGGNSDVFEAC